MRPAASQESGPRCSSAATGYAAAARAGGRVTSATHPAIASGTSSATASSTSAGSDGSAPSSARYRGIAVVEPRAGGAVGQLLAQGSGGVLALGEAALLQDGDDAVDEVLEGPGHHVVHDVDAVDARVMPLLQLVGDLLGRADDLRVGRPADELAEGPGLVGRGLDEALDDPLDVVGLQITDGLIEIDVGDVDADAAGEVRRVATLGRVLVDLALLASGLLLGPAHDEGQPLVEEDVVGVAPVLGGLLLDLVDVRLGALRVAPGDEDRLGVLGGERAAPRGGAGLEKDRRALRAGLGDVRPDDVEVLADVVDVVDLGRVGVDAVGGVLDDGVVVPAALEQLVDDVEVLVGPLVALVVGRQAAVAEVAPGVLEVARDDVPADAAVGQVVEGGEPARVVEGVLMEDRLREREADVLRRVGERGDEEAGIVDRGLEPLLDGGIAVAAVDVVGADDVGEEDRVELASLERLGEVDPGVEVGVLELTGVRAPPLSVMDVGDAVHGECVEAQAARHG